MIINTELGTFGDNEELEEFRTEWDRSLDEYSHDRGSQFFEKMISLKYMGEIVRRILVDLKGQNLVFQSQSLEKMDEPYSLHSDVLCKVESDPIESYDKARMVLGDLGMRNVTNNDCRVVRRVCKWVSTRAAHLMAACCATLMKKVDQKDLAIAVTGDLYHVHPYFATIMKTKIQELMGIDHHIELFEMSTGIGAGFLAANSR